MKRIGNTYYVHISAINTLFEHIPNSEKVRVQNAIEIARKMGHSFHIIKYDKDKISLIFSGDFDIANEPTVGDSLCVKNNGETKIIKASGKIYHKKYLFVNDDYKGFDIEEAKKRAMLWEIIPNTKEHKKKIGNREYWEKLLKENEIPI